MGRALQLAAWASRPRLHLMLECYHQWARLRAKGGLARAAPVLLLQPVLTRAQAVLLTPQIGPSALQRRVVLAKWRCVMARRRTVVSLLALAACCSLAAAQRASSHLT